jgi:hypothetical protein
MFIPQELVIVYKEGSVDALRRAALAWGNSKGDRNRLCWRADRPSNPLLRSHDRDEASSHSDPVLDRRRES